MLAITYAAVVAVTLASSLVDGKPLSRPTTKPSEGRFLWLSDIHYDPYYATSMANNAESGCNGTDAADYIYGKAGCDSPWELVKNTIEASARAIERPDFILYTGDYTRHNIEQLPVNATHEVLSIIQKVADKLDETFPGVPRFHMPLGLLGNDDSTSDYYLNVTNIKTVNPWLQQVANVFKNHMTSEEYALYERTGYFSHEIVPGLHLLSLNTMIYSPKHTPATNASDPFQQFKWLKSTLKSLQDKGENAYITGHIPPILDNFGVAPLWEQKYVDQYLKIVDQYSSAVANQLFGHIHSSTVRANNDDSSSWRAPLITQASVSPVYNNNPTFTIASFKLEDGTVLDLAQYAFNISAANSTNPPEWHQQFESFKQYFGVKSLSNKDVSALAQKILVDNTTWQHYQTWWTGGFLPVYVATNLDASGVCANGECRKAESCGITSWSENMYELCMAK